MATYHFTSATTGCLSPHISICASSCHFSFHRLWTHPFLSNLQGLASTTAKLPKHLATPCPGGGLFSPDTDRFDGCFKGRWE